ncbi:MAG: recombinase family protein [bacterium]|nr:recombinase family protein [bacterium]
MRITTAGTIRAAIYCRKSTDQQEASIGSQKKHLYEYAAKNGYCVVGEFVDAGISGVDTAASRIGFRQLIDAATAGDFTHVLVWDQSRVTRSNPFDTFRELGPLKDAGITLVTMDKGPLDWTSITGIIMTAIESESNNGFVLKMSRAVVRGGADKAAKGLWVGGSPPLGYSIGEDSKLRTNDEAAAVRWIFDQYASGKTLRPIAIGLLKRFGIRIGPQAVGDILRNPTYTGMICWNRKSRAKRHAWRNNGIVPASGAGQSTVADQVRVEDAHEPIVDQILFNEVQIMREANKRKTAPTSHGIYVLSGLVRCARCGNGLYGHTAVKTGIKRYRCRSVERHHDCGSFGIRESDLLQAIFTALAEKLSDENRSQIISEARAELKQQQKKADTKSLQAKRDKLAEKYEKATKRLLDVDDSLVPDLSKHAIEMKAELEQLDQSIRLASVDVDREIDALEHRLSEASDLLDNLVEVWQEADSEHLAACMRAVIDHVEVDVSQQKQGKKHRYTFEGGSIVLRKDGKLSGIACKTFAALMGP